MEDFQTLFLASLRDGSYNDWLREKVEVLRDKRHLWSLRCIQDTGHWVESTIAGVTVESIVISDDGWPPDLKWEKMANTILECDQLAQSLDQPSYYPPVPIYTPPHGIYRTPEQVRAFKKQKEEIEGFARQNITITNSPLSVEDFDAGASSAAQIHPGILNSIIRHERHIHVRETVRTPYYTTNEIITQMGYAVHLITNPKNNSMELLGIYAYKNSKILQELILFITDLDVSNPDDLMAAKITLSALYWSITPKA